GAQGRGPDRRDDRLGHQYVARGIQGPGATADQRVRQLPAAAQAHRIRPLDQRPRDRVRRPWRLPRLTHRGNRRGQRRHPGHHPDYLIFYANGNAGPALSTVGSPATAKDCVSVGASGDGASLNTLASFSSRGPCADMRRKPTIVAPGVSVISSTTGDSAYVA